MGKGGYNGGSSVVGWGSTAWVGRGSPTSQPGTKPKRGVKPGKPKPSKSKAAKTGRRKVASSPQGAGLTIAEIVAKAQRRVRSIENDIAKTTRHLADLQRQLTSAKKQLEEARNLPRRSALGRALAEAEKAKETKTTKAHELPDR